MLARTAPRPFDHSDWLYELKWDGYRCLAFIDGGLFLQSRNGTNLTPRYPELHVLAGALRGPLILDGEVVAFSGGLPDFGRLQRLSGFGGAPLRYLVFDVLHARGEDTVDLPLHLRRQILRDLLAATPGGEALPVQLSEAVAGQGIDLYRGAAALGLEGIMAKHRDGAYRPGSRTHLWLKVRHVRRDDFVIAGVVAGRRSGFGAFLLGAYDPGGRLRCVGQVGTGLDDAEVAAVLQRLRPRRESPFAGGARPDPETVFVEPELVCRVEYLQWTADGLLRHPVYRGLREDMEAESCRLPGDHPGGAGPAGVGGPAAEGGRSGDDARPPAGDEGP